MSPISRDGSRVVLFLFRSMDPFIKIHGSTGDRPTGPRISPGEPSRLNYGLVTEIADRRQKLNIPFRPSSPNR